MATRKRPPGTVSRAEYHEQVSARVASDIKTVRTLAGWGWSDRTIAGHLNCSKTWVGKLRERAGIPPGDRSAEPRFDLEDSEEL